MLHEVRETWRQSRKPSDSLFNTYVVRPPAAAIVLALRGTAVTPNQISFASLFVHALGAVAFVAFDGPTGLWAGVALVELARVLDCADGQLARLTGRGSPVGAALDFMMDELKAYLLIGALSARWMLHDGGGPHALLIGGGTLVVLASALSLTRFTRSAVYAEATGTTPLRDGEAAGAARRQGGPLWPVLAAARLVSQYPQSLPVFALLGRMDVFIYAYGAVHLLYLGRTGATILWRLGRRSSGRSGSGRGGSGDE